MPRNTMMRALTAVAMLAATPAAPAQTTFKVATVVPESSHWVTAMRAGAVEIEQRTAGRVKFKFYTGGVQGKDNQVVRKMRIGQLHGGAFTSGGLGAFHRDAEIYGLPMVFRDLEEVRFVRERLDDTLRQRLEEAGYVNFGIAGGGFAYLMSKSPIASRKDMRGMKIWIPEGDEVARSAAGTLGIAAVTLPLTDVLTGLQTGLIDTVMGPPVGALVMQWHTIVQYITEVPIAYVYGMLILDARAFGRISEADQEVVREVMEAVYGEFNAKGIRDDQDALGALLDEGLEMVEVAAPESAEWRRLVEESNRSSGRAGAFDMALFNRIECYLKAYRTGTDGAGCKP